LFGGARRYLLRAGMLVPRPASTCQRHSRHVGQFRRGLNNTIPRADDDNALTPELVWTVVLVGVENLPAECRLTWQLRPVWCRGGDSLAR